MATIECLYGSYQGRKVALREGQIFVGRSVSHGMAFPDDPFLSATHAVITVHQGQCYVADLGSKNGTFLNGLKIDSHEHHIKDGSIVRFGQQEFRIRVSNMPQTATTPPSKVVPPPVTTVKTPPKVAQPQATEAQDKGFSIQLVLCPLCRQQIAINLYGFGVHITCPKCKSPFLRIDAIVIVPPSQQPASAHAPSWVPSTRPTSQITIPPSSPGVLTPSTSDSDPVVIKPKSADSTYALPKQPNVAVVDPLAKFKEVRWFGRGTVVSFGDWKLVDPLCYVGLNAGASDPSTVDPSLPAHVNFPTQPIRDGLLKYKDLSTKQRYLYLQWLASGRTTTCSENLMLLFLQGVERRLLELPSDSPEKLGLLDELNRMCLRSQSKKDFVKYAAKWVALRWLIKGSAISLDLEYLPRDENDDHYLEWAIACMASKEEPFRRQQAIQWLVRQKPHITANSVNIEDWANFKALFEIRLATVLPEQLTLTRGARQVIWEIPFANQSLHAVSGQIYSVSLNRPDETDHIYRTMDDCFESCAEAFESLREYRAKFTWHVNSSRSELFLPQELFLRTKVCQRLRAALDRNSLGSICNLKDLQEELWMGVDSFGHEFEALVGCSESLGFMIQPDPRLRVLEPNRIKTVLIERGQVVLESGDRPALATAMKSLWLGGWYESPEVLEGIIKVISSTFDLHDGANRHLHLFARWLTAAAVKAPKSLALSVPEAHQAVTAKCFLDCLSVHSSPSIVKAVTNAMSSWGFDWSVVYGRLDMSSPRTGGKGETKSRSAYQVDKSLAAQIMEESAITSKMIDEVFNVVELDHAAIPMVSESSSQSKGPEFGVRTDLASPSSTRAIISILKGGEMSKQEFQALALAHGVMVSALVEQLNDFAIDSCGAVLVIQGESFEIDEEILRELANDEHQN